MLFAAALALGVGCSAPTPPPSGGGDTPSPAAPEPSRTQPDATTADADRIRLIIDTDANNELDDQHALVYVLLSGDAFAVEGITVNATRGGGDVQEQLTEARRVLALTTLEGRIPLLAGADGSFEAIRPHLDDPDFDGAEAVDFIIERAHAASGARLVLLPIGKLTNVALALAKDPSIASKIRIVWLGSNYPEPGEYNQENDPESVRYVLQQNVPFEIATVRYGAGTGTDAVRVTRAEIESRMKGLGPQAAKPVTGRHGGTFRTFGDYSVNLFAHITLDGTPPSRALYDVAAAAILKNPYWARRQEQPAPELVGEHWIDRPRNSRRVTIWTDFKRDAIVNDLLQTLAAPILATP